MDIRSRLKDGVPLLFDGAMGTYYASRPGNAGKRCEPANLLDPQTVTGIHRAYLTAGCRAVKTNTFMVSADLAAGDESAAKEFIAAGSRLALDAVRGMDAYVFGCIGPAPESASGTAADIYIRQAAWFLAQGITCFLLETQSSDAGIAQTARFIHTHARPAYVIVSYAVGPDGMTSAGLSGRELYLRTAELADIDAAGFNCVMGPQHLREYVRTLPRTGKTLSVMPNAGYPAVVGRRVTFGGRPDYFGQKIAQIVTDGASIVGGCCGTTPEHIAAAAKALKTIGPRVHPTQSDTIPTQSDANPQSVDAISTQSGTNPQSSDTIPTRSDANPQSSDVIPVRSDTSGVRIRSPQNAQNPSGNEQNEHKNEQSDNNAQDTAPSGVKQDLAAKFASGKRVIAVELDPPPDDDAEYFFDGVKILRDAGADLITIADCPVGRPRADSSLLACKVKREFGIEPLPHIACRDRNLNATKALLLGLAIEGVRNVLFVTGDPIPTENRDEVKSVFNFHSRKLARYVQSLNETLRTPFCMFGALNVNAKNFDRQLEFALEKESCGMSGFLTQPVLSPEALENLRKARTVLHGKILGGIFPIVSYRNACFLNNEIAGIRVSEEIIALYRDKDRDAAETLAIDLSVRTAREIVSCTDGLYIMTPFKRVSLVREILSRV